MQLVDVGFGDGRGADEVAPDCIPRLNGCGHKAAYAD